MELQPWISVCDSRCAFCYFPTTASSKVQLEPYLDVVKKELEMYAKTNYVKTSLFDEIVLGGGTPSVFSAEQIIDFIDFCKAALIQVKNTLLKSLDHQKPSNLIKSTNWPITEFIKWTWAPKLLTINFVNPLPT